jgi:phage gpG-like protein
MLNVDIHITGTADVIAKFKRLNLSLTDFKPIMEKVGSEVSKYYRGQVFASQGGVFGVKWPTTLAATTKYKLKHYPQYATTPLIRTGDMQNSFRFDADNNSVTISNPTPYFKYHQSSAARKSNLPRRQMMGINNPVKSIVRQIIDADIKAKLRSI